MNTAAFIAPETVAAKLAALKNLAAPKFAAALEKQPRLIELAWSLQWHSQQPGGLAKFSQDFAAQFPARIGTSEMRRVARTDQPYTAAERQEVIASFEHFHHGDAAEAEILDQFSREMLGITHYNFRHEKPNAAFVNKQNHPYFSDLCRRVAVAALPALLADFCAKPDAALPDVWWFHDLPGALVEMLDHHAAHAARQIVTTQITAQIFDALDFAWTEKAMIEIIGDSRFGKTESVQAWCAAYPGRARLVNTPCDNCDRTLWEAIASALGVHFTPKTTPRQLRASVEFVLKHSGLMLIFDEAAWLIPQRYSQKTAPMRLNYIRSMVLQNGCPVALVTTPQFFGPAAQKFERTTGFNMAQWKGRIMRTVQLPPELPDEDLAAVARHHCPELSPAGIKRVVACALLCESYLFAVLGISKNARAVARKKGRDTIQLDDLDEGIALAGINLARLAAPSPAAPAAATAAPGRNHPIAVKRGRSVKPQASSAPPALEAPARSITPALETQPV